MEATIDLLDPVFRRVKAVASPRGITLKRFFSEAIARELEFPNETVARGKPVKLPLVPSRRPGSNRLTPQKAADLLEREDLDCIA